MTLPLETRPERARYNVGVALRLVDQLLSELDVDASPCEGADDRQVADRIAHALMLAESLESGEPSPRNHLSLRLRGTLRSLLVDLERAASGTSQATH